MWSKIFAHTLEGQLTMLHTDNPLPITRPHLFSSNAVNLFNISHVCALFREVALNNPGLWAMVSSLNGLSVDLLQAILRRSQAHPLTLSFSEDSTLPTGREIWHTIMPEYSRVAFLRIHVADGYPGAKLQALLTVPAPTLQHCTIQFSGKRNVCLDFFVPNTLRPFGGCCPQLQQLDLINCYIPPKHYRFPQLTSTSVRCDTILLPNISFISIKDCFEWRPQFKYLHHLVLRNSLEPVSETDLPNNLYLIPLDLPVLKTIDIVASPNTCHQLATILRLPPHCSRRITFLFPPDQRFSIVSSAKAAAGAAAMFVSPDVVYTGCALGMKDHHSFLRLLSFGREIVTIKLDIYHLRIDCSNPISSVFKALAWPIAAFHEQVISDMFLYRFWDDMSSILRQALASLGVIHLFFDRHSPASHIFSPVLVRLSRVQTVVVYSSDVWTSRCFDYILCRSIFPRMKNLILPLDDSVTHAVSTSIARFLEERIKVDHLLFRVSAYQVELMGYAAPEEIRSKIGTICKDFPQSVELDWVVL
ncbi:hypothetical protein EST38_g2588 [Candolleomyces aberdarensis]|uniref:F-box domain-containing protein n=1 Tax=Candolleomyces aberdarensis TaxID=2316362 RepID=A0A4V1Q4T9_9AGAR|nr:hypothetical protein EST38_g2588 [Candolleomyces aberdarensis]